MGDMHLTREGATELEDSIYFSVQIKVPVRSSTLPFLRLSCYANCGTPVSRRHYLTPFI